MKRENARRQDWNNLPMSDRRIQLPVEAIFSTSDLRKLKRGVIPVQMEDKWFIFFEDDCLFFHRSWTGYCVYQARIEKEDRHFKLTEVWATRDSEQYTNSDIGYDIEVFLFLVYSYLLGKTPPLPRGKASESTDHTVEMWSLFGRHITDDDE